MNNNLTKNDIELLLPFYVNGSLDADEQEEVEQALANDSELQQELAYLQALRTQVQQQQRDNSPGELGLKRLQKTLAEQKDNNEVMQQRAISSSANRWRFLAIAACLMLVVQTVVDNDSGSNIYNAAGGKTAIQHQGQLVSVTFAPDITEQAMRQFLLETNVAIVDGPSALGIYRLSVADDLDEVMMIFKARPDLIESIQKDQ